MQELTYSVNLLDNAKRILKVISKDFPETNLI